MPDVVVRKSSITIDEIFHEGGPAVEQPLRRAVVCTVIANPFAGRYVEEIIGFIDDLKPLGLQMARDLIAALGGDPGVVEAYGKGAIVGAAGEMPVALVMTTGARVHNRAGGLAAADIKGEDGLK